MPNENVNLVGKVVKTERASNSKNGNPAFWVTIEGPLGDTHTVRTQTDSMIAYGIENREYREQQHLFKLTKAGRLFSAELHEMHHTEES